MLKNKLPFTLGYELTAVYRHYRHDKYVVCGKKRVNTGHCNHKTTQKNKKVSGLLVSFLRKKGYKMPHSFLNWRQKRTKKVYVDGHCIEIPSPVFKTVEDAIKFYDICWSFLKKRDFQPKHNLTVCGGNHLHFGITDVSWIRAIFRDLISRHYITWVFTEPDDTDSCDNFNNNLMWFIERHCFGAIQEEQNQNNIINLLFTNKNIDITKIDDNKEQNICINNKGKTLEFRCVEAPRNRQEFLEQLEFFVAYVLWIKERMKEKQFYAPKLLSRREIQRLNPQTAIKRFNQLLDKLGLDKEKYSKYIKRNLLPRWELDRERT